LGIKRQPKKVAIISFLQQRSANILLRASDNLRFRLSPAQLTQFCKRTEATKKKNFRLSTNHDVRDDGHKISVQS
jgi:hypothetical protein